MKNIILFLLIPFLSFSQEDVTCKQLSIKVLNLAYRDEPSFNSYLKNNNCCIDIDYPIEANSYEYKRVQSHADNSMMESSKDSMFNVFRTMVTTGFFNYSDVEECTFDNINFNLTYVTSDRQRISFHFRFSFNDLVKIKDRLNRDEALSYMFYLGKY